MITKKLLILLFGVALFCSCNQDSDILGILYPETNEYDINSLDDKTTSSETLDIFYPETGEYGINILNDNVKSVKATGSKFGRVEYSVKAELPDGNSSLIIVIRTKKLSYRCDAMDCRAIFAEMHDVCPSCGGVNTIEYFVAYGWGGFNQYSDENWLITNIVDHFTFTVVESGKSSDASVIFFNDCIIEFYENGAEEPTKVKEITAIK